MFVEFFHEGIGIELFHVVHTGLVPYTLHEETRADAGRNTSGVAHALHTRFVISSLVRAVVVDVVGVFLTILDTTDTATDRGFSLIVFTQILGIGEDRFEELEGLDHVSLVVDGDDGVHTDVLDHTQVGEIFLSKGHPEARALDGGEIDDKTLDFFVVEEIALTRTHVGIGQRLVDFERFCLHPFTIFPIKSLLRDFADVDFGIEVGGKGFAVVTSVAVYDVEIVDFVEVVLCCVSSVDRGDPRVETATEDGAKSSFLKAFAISPLPRIFKVCFIFGFVVGSVEIVTTGFKASLHDGEVLIGKREIHHQIGLERFEKCHQFRHVVGIHLRRFDVVAQAHVGNAFGDSFALRHGARSNHDFVKNIGVFRHFHGGNGGDTTSANDENFTHFLLSYA